MRENPRSLTLVSLAVALWLPSCKKPAAVTASVKPKPNVTLLTARGTRKFDDRGKVVQSYDTNRDGNPDLWKVLRTVQGADGKQVEVLERMELDINYDGKIDVWRFYNDKSELVREEMDLDFDGKIDVAVIYEAGKVVRKELSQGFDESVKVWKHYEDGQLSRVERITKTGGKIPDTFELVQEGKVVAVGYDKDGDGRPDLWQKVKEKLPDRKSADGGAEAESPPPASGTPADGGAGSADGGAPASPAAPGADGGTTNPMARPPRKAPAQEPARP